jgi:GNAT superfamily N-acetyltransferase
LGKAATRPAIAIRRFEPADETQVLGLLGATLGGGPAGQRPASFFRWKHLENPFGPSLMLVAEADSRIIGLRAFLRWRFVAGGGTFEAVRAVDTATHPDYQGMGVFSRLTTTALAMLNGHADLVYNTPNGASRPGYLKLGWRDIGRVPVMVRARRPVRLLRGLRRPGGLPARPTVAAMPAARVLEQGTAISRLLAETEADDRLRTSRDVPYLRWRYGAAPLLGYHAVTVEASRRLRGLAIFRVRPRGGLWESTVAELLVPAGDWRTAQRLLRRVTGAAPVDHLTLHASSRALTVSALGAGYVPAPGGISFVVKPLRDGLDPDPSTLAAWALSLGDLEVF